jgi:hypothetical protein
MYRLINYAEKLPEHFSLDEKTKLSVFMSKKNKVFRQFCFIPEKFEGNQAGVIPLFAHIMVSSNTGHIKIDAFQPELFNLNPVDIEKIKCSLILHIEKQINNTGIQDF